MKTSHPAFGHIYAEMVLEHILLHQHLFVYMIKVLGGLSSLLVIFDPGQGPRPFFTGDQRESILVPAPYQPSSIIMISLIIVSSSYLFFLRSKLYFLEDRFILKKYFLEKCINVRALYLLWESISFNRYYLCMYHCLKKCSLPQLILKV